jgi:hypothetical protein
MCDPNRTILSFRWPSQCKVGDRNGSTKLTTWDALRSKDEVENIKPLLARIQGLQKAAGSGLIGTQLMAFFL